MSVTRSVLPLLFAVSFACGLSARAGAQASNALDGVWKIAAPSEQLKPLDGPVPFTVEGRRKYDENKRARAAGRIKDYDITLARCSTPGVPRLMLTPMRFKIWNQLGVVTFDYEWNRAIRQVDARGIATEAPLVPNFNGVGKGHWEGDTLVITTNDVAERTLIDDLVPHSADLKVTERLKLLDPNTLEDRVSIDDPRTFTRPWDAVITYKRQPNAIFAEDVCLDRIEAKQPAFPQAGRAAQ